MERQLFVYLYVAVMLRAVNQTPLLSQVKSQL